MNSLVAVERLDTTYGKLLVTYSDLTHLEVHLRAPDSNRSPFDSAALYKDRWLEAIIAEERLDEPVYFWTKNNQPITFLPYIELLEAHVESFVSEHVHPPEGIQRLELLLPSMQRIKDAPLVACVDPPREYSRRI